MANETGERAIAPDVSDRNLARLWSLGGRVAVVTGGGRGIGLAIAARLAEAGAHVVLADLVDDRAAEAALGLVAKGFQASTVTLDVRSRASADEAFKALAAKLGAVDILVNNAGLLPRSPYIAEMDDELWQTVFDVNVHGVVRASRAAIPYLSASRFGGSIVNLSSTAAFRIPNVGTAPYTASKHAINAINKSLALELAPRGIRVNAVAPTAVETPGLQELRAATSGLATPLGNVSAIANALPLGRIAVPDDVARAVLFLASDMATLITGTTLAVDAGSMIR